MSLRNVIAVLQFTINFFDRFISFTWLTKTNKKQASKMLVKLTPGPQKDPENLTVFLALSGSESVKATCRMLMKFFFHDLFIYNLSKLALDREQGSISSIFYEKILGT